MRPLTVEETQTFFEKLAKIISRNISSLLNREDAIYVFRIHRDRVYYIQYVYILLISREEIMKKATSIPRDSLLSLGICFGKFTKSGKFKLHITALEYLAPYAKYKVWVKPNGEMPFMYGNHVLKAHLGRITEDTPEHQGVVVYSMSNVPLVCLLRVSCAGFWSDC